MIHLIHMRSSISNEPEGKRWILRERVPQNRLYNKNIPFKMRNFIEKNLFIFTVSSFSSEKSKLDNFIQYTLGGDTSGILLQNGRKIANNSIKSTWK